MPSLSPVINDIFDLFQPFIIPLLSFPSLSLTTSIPAEGSINSIILQNTILHEAKMRTQGICPTSAFWYSATICFTAVFLRHNYKQRTDYTARCYLDCDIQSLLVGCITERGIGKSSCGCYC